MTFAGVDEVENRDTLTNDQLNEEANETPNLFIFVKCFGGTFVRPGGTFLGPGGT